jgi:Flp pilus assembly protein TadG
MLPVWTKLRRALTAFAGARGGNVALTFAMATLPIIGGVGAAVDFSRANSIKSAMQAALDSTALMLAKEATTDTASQLQTNANNYFKALFNRTDAPNPTITASYTTSGGSAVVVNGSVSMPTNFLGVIGYNSLTINSSSTTKWGSTRLRVALVLDNTGSMQDDGKMTALKSATKGLLTQLQSAASNNGDVYVSIIPFSKDVNVGSSYSNASWIDWSDWEDNNGSWQTTSSCTNKYSRWGKNYCNNTQIWVPANHNTWNGCITDRDQNYDQLSTAPNPSDVSLPDTTASTLFPAEQYGNCPLAMMGLSYNWASMNSLVDQMYPNGNTNQPVGLVWGWQSLVGGGPLTAPAKDPNYTYQEVIVLMSDGLNTQNRWSTNQSTIDKRMYDSTKSGAGTCANIKAAGITIYAVQVNTGGDPKSTLMQNCASTSDKFWMVTSSNGLGSVFSMIGNSLTQLRVAK